MKHLTEIYIYIYIYILKKKQLYSDSAQNICAFWYFDIQEKTSVGGVKTKTKLEIDY